MATIQVVIGKKLLRSADRAARRRRISRSALVRHALRAYLRRLAVEEREDQDRAGYVGDAGLEFTTWDRVASWPDE